MNIHDNPAELLTKVIPIIDKQQIFVQMIQHHVIGYFRRQLRLQSVGTIIGIKPFMMSTYA